jgi:hypothetical protein
MRELRVKVGRKKLESFERLIALEMLGHTVIGSARILNVSRETIYTWKKDPVFIAMKTRERSEFLVATTDAIIGASLDAVRHLQDVVTDFRIPKVDRVPAALALHDLSKNVTGSMSTNLTFNDKGSHDPALAQHLFPQVVEDRKSKKLAASKAKELAAPAKQPDEVLPPLPELPATTQRFDELFQQLHEQQPTGE